ncbi:carboxymuconolactone decarboxylase family protein [Actinophytocola sediminis]
MFVDHTVESAPPAARRAMAATADRLGYLPAPVARMAESPPLLDGFLKLSAMFETSTLDQLARETVIMTVAVRNGCAVCVAMHTATLTRLGADPGLIAALRAGTPVPDPRLAAVQEFTVDVLESAGAVGEQRLSTFLANGFTRRQALEVVLGIGAYTLSTVANRLTGAPLDEQLAAFR